MVFLYPSSAAKNKKKTLLISKERTGKDLGPRRGERWSKAGCAQVG